MVGARFFEYWQEHGGVGCRVDASRELDLRAKLAQLETRTTEFGFQLEHALDVSSSASSSSHPPRPSLSPFESVATAVTSTVARKSKRLTQFHASTLAPEIAELHSEFVASNDQRISAERDIKELFAAQCRSILKHTPVVEVATKVTQISEYDMKKMEFNCTVLVMLNWRDESLWPYVTLNAATGRLEAYGGQMSAEILRNHFVPRFNVGDARLIETEDPVFAVAKELSSPVDVKCVIARARARVCVLCCVCARLLRMAFFFLFSPMHGCFGVNTVHTQSASLNLIARCAPATTTTTAAAFSAATAVP